ncbi:MAG TPA: hypothetical protein VHQ04_14025 [Puia sp.]|nr:hypothetical protein [Puia sp.]
MDNLQWGQPWNFFFDQGLSEPARNKKMNDIASNLYSYVEKSLGGPQFFTLQISWSFSSDLDNLYQMYANLIVNQAGVVSWQQKNEKANKKANLKNQVEAAIGIDKTGELSLGGSKPPPPPPPPPVREDILGMEPPFKFFSNDFLLSHVLEFNARGEVQKFNETSLKPVGGAIV